MAALQRLNLATMVAHGASGGAPERPGGSKNCAQLTVRATRLTTRRKTPNKFQSDSFGGLNVRRVAENRVQLDRFPDETSRRATADRIVLAEFDRRHLVLAARLQPLLDRVQALATPEAEQHP